jgi:hypothetical protein
MNTKQFCNSLSGLSLVVALVAALALSLLPQPAKADSFNTTNVIASGGVGGTWPTNSLNTNGLGMKQGSWIDVRNVTQAGFYFTGTPIINATGIVVTVNLVRSWAQIPSLTIDPTNGLASLATNWIYGNSWEHPNNGITFSFAIPTQTNAFSFFTNLGEGYIYGANAVGLYGITNNGTSSVLTNVDVGLVKKIPPLRWP